jgi:hypothetical protein
VNPVFHDSGKIRDEIIEKAKRHSYVFPKKTPTTLSPNFHSSRMPKDSLKLQNSIWLAPISKETPRITENHGRHIQDPDSCSAVYLR